MQPYLNDQYAPLAHIPELRGHEALPGKTWIDQTDRRRLAAYGVLGAYRTNTRRFHLPESVWQAGDDSDAGGKNVREYGDPSLSTPPAPSSSVTSRPSPLTTPPRRCSSSG